MFKDSSDSLREEIKNLADTLDEVLNNSSETSKDELDNIRDQARSVLEISRERLEESGEHLMESTRKLVNYADSYLHKHPWYGVGLGAIFGVMLSIFIYSES
ncbi:DUF883 family protein [Candidatus Ishikawella capsulata]|uniref:DUF883 domain-containing protein n=1 Tax=Candidatus Ishikawaella capsulata Mpkobe TaxID=476281 RepID=C5WDL6_9ENTR|nr:DUF883 family protein [Candidatus Ishikawaella capsulata]BAH83422.1 hypothetical protein ICMP_582 [Candidatus Ishikawaella capsulata Mpkobe]